MFLKVLCTLGFVIAMGSVSFAAGDGDHTADVCSATNPNVCAHLGHMSKVNSTDEVQFVAHVMTPNEEQIENLKVVLWMPSMGHGSSPVAIKQFGVNRYKVTQAYFMMPGQWSVKLSFTLGGVQHRMEFPVVVE